MGQAMTAPGHRGEGDAPFAEADYVVVGGGSAGCVVAGRLSEDPAATVILVEAGKRDRSSYIHLPVMHYKTTGPAFTWGHQTAPSRHQGGVVTPFPQAKVLGGGSSINAQIYIRGIPQDYDAWRNDFGCGGWSYDDVLPYFIRSEDNLSFANEYHGVDGPLKVSNQKFTHPLTYAWLRACQQAGIPFNSDFNARDRAGCGLYQVTNRNGRRSSAATAYLRLAELRSNISVITDAHALRLIVRNKRALGIEAWHRSAKRVIKARREVIVAAGAIGTPHLLMLSGIGPADRLQQSGIEVVKDLPAVGRNLQDHPDIFMTYELTGAHSYDKYRKLNWRAWAALQFAAFGTGPITSNGFEGGAFWWVDPTDGTPDVQFSFLVATRVKTGIADVPCGNGCTLTANLVRPKSRGTVSLRSTDPFAPPQINPNYFSEADDLEKTVAGVKLGRVIMSQAALSGFIKCEHFPGEEVSTEDELASFVRKQARTAYHPAGTCRMGSDQESVVDTQLRVRGVDGLRIADNSIMPRLVSGNTNATAIMIGERAADFIKVKISS
jgi:choline dehydrogenase-like flavoprotein